MNQSVPKLAITAGVAASLIVLAGCQHLAKINKVGQAPEKVTVITLQMPDSGDPDGLFFAQDVARRSHGTLKVLVDTTTYNNGSPSSEPRLVSAMRNGQVAFSYQPARDWAAAGVSGFQALDAPFLVTTVRASELLARSSVAPALLQQLSSLGLVGIGLIPSQPRQILSTDPLFAPSAFHALRVRIISSAETATFVTALGARPVQGTTAEAVNRLLQSGSIGAVESSAIGIQANSYNALAPYLTSYGVFPKFETVVATQTAWAALTNQQQTAIHQAVADTLKHSSAVPARETTQLQQLCRDGLVLDEASPTELAAIARVSDAPPLSAAAASMARTIRTTVPGTGPRRQALPLPFGCHPAHTVAQAKRVHRLLITPVSRGTSGASIPPGTYVTTDTVADFRAGGQVGPDWNKTTTWTWTLGADGSVSQTQQPSYPDARGARGRYMVKGDEVTFIWNVNTGLTNEILRWSYFDGQLTFKIIYVQDAGSRITYTAHPWSRVD